MLATESDSTQVCPSILMMTAMVCPTPVMRFNDPLSQLIQIQTEWATIAMLIQRIQIGKLSN